MLWKTMLKKMYFFFTNFTNDCVQCLYLSSWRQNKYAAHLLQRPLFATPTDWRFHIYSWQHHITKTQPHSLRARAGFPLCIHINAWKKMSRIEWSVGETQSGVECLNGGSTLRWRFINSVSSSSLAFSYRSKVSLVSFHMFREYV